MQLGATTLSVFPGISRAVRGEQRQGKSIDLNKKGKIWGRPTDSLSDRPIRFYYRVAGSRYPNG